MCCLTEEEGDAERTSPRQRTLDFFGGFGSTLPVLRSLDCASLRKLRFCAEGIVVVTVEYRSLGNGVFKRNPEQIHAPRKESAHSCAMLEVLIGKMLYKHDSCWKLRRLRRPLEARSFRLPRQPPFAARTGYRNLRPQAALCPTTRPTRKMFMRAHCYEGAAS